MNKNQHFLKKKKDCPFSWIFEELTILRLAKLRESNYLISRYLQEFIIKVIKTQTHILLEQLEILLMNQYKFSNLISTNIHRTYTEKGIHLY